MSGARVWLAVMPALAIAAGHGAASAQPAPGPLEGDAAYPRALVDRPLRLPAGLSESAAEFMVYTFAYDDVRETRLYLAPSLRWGLGPVELDVGLRAHLSGGTVSDRYSASVGGRAQLIGGLVLGGALDVYDSDQLWGSASLEHKQRLGEGVSLVAGAELGMALGGELHTHSAVARLGSQMQLGATTALEVNVRVGVADSGFSGVNVETFQRYEVRVLAAPARAFDVFAGFEHGPGDVQWTTATIGVAARHQP